MDVDEAKPAAPAAASADGKDKEQPEAAAAAEGDDAAAKAKAADAGADKGKEKEKEKEPSSFTMTAPCRVVPHQVKHVSLPAGECWTTMCAGYCRCCCCPYPVKHTCLCSCECGFSAVSFVQQGNLQVHHDCSMYHRHGCSTGVDIKSLIYCSADVLVDQASTLLPILWTTVTTPGRLTRRKEVSHIPMFWFLQQDACSNVMSLHVNPAGSRWAPVKRGAALSGILVLRDLQPGEPVEYANTGAAAAPGAAAAAAGGIAAAQQQQQQQEPEPAPPAPFGECRSVEMYMSCAPLLLWLENCQCWLENSRC